MFEEAGAETEGGRELLPLGEKESKGNGAQGRLLTRGQHGGASGLPTRQPLSQENVDQYTIGNTTVTFTVRTARRGAAARWVLAVS